MTSLIFESFTIDVIDGLVPRTELGKLGFKKAEMPKLNKPGVLSRKLFGRQEFNKPESNRTQVDLKGTMNRMALNDKTKLKSRDLV